MRKLLLLLNFFFLIQSYHCYQPSQAEQCEELGEYRYAIEQDKYRRDHLNQMHVFQAPPPNNHLYLDVPPKNGNHNWAGLFYSLWYHRPPPNFDTVRSLVESFSKRDNYASNDSIWLVTRSPYVRILSIYLEKIYCHDSLTQHHYLAGFGIFKGLGKLTFEQFLVNLTSRLITATHKKKHVTWMDFVPDSYNEWRQLRGSHQNSSSHYYGRREKSRYWNWDFISRMFQGRAAQRGGRDLDYNRTIEYLKRKYGRITTVQDERNHTMFNACHFTMTASELNSIIDPTGNVQLGMLPSDIQLTPIERGARLCSLDHHLCIQSVGLFKQQPGKMRILQLERQGRWFKQFTECFGVEVDDINGVDWNKFSKQPCFYTPTGNCKEALRRVDSAALTKGGVHGVGAVHLMDQHYTPLAAQLVDYLYAYDFYTLGYRSWDAKSSFDVSSNII